MGSAVQRAMKGNLDHPVLYRPFGPIIKETLPVNVEKTLLDYIFGFTSVTDDPECDPKRQTGIAVEKDFQGGSIIPLQAGHCFVVSGYAESWEFWRGGR